MRLPWTSVLYTPWSYVCIQPTLVYYSIQHADGRDVVFLHRRLMAPNWNIVRYVLTIPSVRFYTDEHPEQTASSERQSIDWQKRRRYNGNNWVGVIGATHNEMMGNKCARLWVYMLQVLELFTKYSPRQTAHKVLTVSVDYSARGTRRYAIIDLDSSEYWIVSLELAIVMYIMDIWVR